MKNFISAILLIGIFALGGCGTANTPQTAPSAKTQGSNTRDSFKPSGDETWDRANSLLENFNNDG